MDLVEVLDIAGGLLALATALGPLAALAILIRQWRRLGWGNRPLLWGRAR
jgi:hypothetical protein